MKNKIVFSTLILSAGALLAKLLGALYRIPLSNILGAEGMGLYQMVFPIYSLLLVIITGGVPVYVSQKVAYYRAENNTEAINKLIKSAKILAGVLGAFIGLILFLFSQNFASLQGNDDAALGYMAVSISVAFTCLISVYRGMFQGFENVIPTSLTQIIEQFIKLVLGISLSLILVQHGLIYGVAGALLAVSVSEIISFGFVWLYAKFKQNSIFYKKVRISFTEVKETAIRAMPLSIYSIMIPLMTAIDSFIIINLLITSGFMSELATSLFGLYSGMVAPIIGFPTIFCANICIALLPSLSFKIKKNQEISTTLAKTFKFVWAFTVPCAVGLMTISPIIFKAFYPVLESSLSTTGILMLEISALNIVFLSIIQITSAVLQAHGKFKKPIISLGVCFLLRLVLSIVLVSMPQINIVGLAIANCVGLLVAAIINLIFVKKLTSIKLNFFEIIIPFLAAIIMGLIIILLRGMININLYLKLFLIMGIGGIIYLAFIFIFKLFTLKDIVDIFKK